MQRVRKSKKGKGSTTPIVVFFFIKLPAKMGVTLQSMKSAHYLPYYTHLKEQSNGRMQGMKKLMTTVKETKKSKNKN